MARNQNTFAKRQREQQKKEKREAKRERREKRKLEGNLETAVPDIPDYENNDEVEPEIGDDAPQTAG